MKLTARDHWIFFKMMCMTMPIVFIGLLSMFSVVGYALSRTSSPTIILLSIFGGSTIYTATSIIVAFVGSFYYKKQYACIEMPSETDPSTTAGES